MKRLLLVALAALALPGAPAAAQGLPPLHAQGPQVVDNAGREVRLRGVNVGGWLLQESYILKTDSLGSQGRIKRALLRTLPEAAVEQFYADYRARYITQADIDFIADQGFNCVRVPFHYDLLLTPAQRHARNQALATGNVAAYVGALAGYYDRNELFTQPEQAPGFALLDNVIKWCAARKMYVVLDLHAAPGGQGTDPNINDNLAPLDLWKRRDAKGRLLYQDVTVRLWETLARRYKNTPAVAMYDLINEPHNMNAAHGLSANHAELNALYSRLITAVRAQGDHHLLLLEGDGYGNNYAGLTPAELKISDKTNLVYNAHHYWDTNDPQAADATNPDQISRIGGMVKFRAAQRVPVWVGEIGENSNEWLAAAYRALDAAGIGWCHWTLKRVDGRTNLLDVKPYGSILDADGRAALLRNCLFANCQVNRDVVDALTRQLGNYATQPFVSLTVPGVVRAPDYDLGRNGQAYFDTYAEKTEGLQAPAPNAGGAYRNDGVDLDPDPAGPGFVVSHTAAGEWLNYTVRVGREAPFAAVLRAANPTAQPARLALSLDGTRLGTFDVPANAAAADWPLAAQGPLPLPPGNHTLRLTVETPGAVLSSMTFKAVPK
ncbi:MAG: cellulase family glycosylhydrolase [Janthinobacterium lividum]